MGALIPSPEGAPVQFANPHGLDFGPGNPGVRVPDSPSLSLTGRFTLCAWVRLRQLGPQPYHGVIEKWEMNAAGMAQNGYYLRVDAGGNVRAGVLGGTNKIEFGGSRKLPLGTWVHLAFVNDGVNLKLYVDGVADGSAPAIFMPTGGTSPLEIGRAMGNNALAGMMDDVRIYSIALGGADITQLVRGYP
jgi:hypothetical protein